MYGQAKLNSNTRPSTYTRNEVLQERGLWSICTSIYKLLYLVRDVC